MLRSKKFNTLKHICINELFDIYTDEPFKSQFPNKYIIDKNNYILDIDIKCKDKYELIKETILEPYILKLKDSLLIHIKDDLINDFEFLYKKSNKYAFDIYETSLPHLKDTGKYIKMYHIFCVSQNLDNITYNSFLKSNDSDTKYYCLSLFYGPCLIVNKRFDVTSDFDKYQSKYKYIKSIGKGYVDKNIRTFTQFIIKMLNDYQDTLPPHYLKIN
jgi:hypothetical protein